MAANAGSGDDVETVTRQICSICLETLRQPRKLPCDHIFCDVCLHGYLEKCLLSSDVNAFPCPLCRSNIKIKQKDDSQIAEVENQFELLSFSDDENESRSQNESRSREQATTNCESCLRDDIKIPAAKFCADCDENICNDCIKYHRRNKLLSSHILKDMVVVGDSVNGTSLDRSQRANLFDNQLKCQRHKLKRFKYICTQHDTLCCSKCAIMDHRQCENLRQLDEYAASSFFNNEREQVHQRIQNIKEKSKNLLVHETLVEKMLNEKKIHLTEQSEEFKRGILKVLDEELNGFHTKSYSLISNMIHTSQVNRQKVDSLMLELEDFEKSLEVAEQDDTESGKKVAAVLLVREYLNRPCQVITECLNRASNNTVECSVNTNILKGTIRNCLKISVSKIPSSDAAGFQLTCDKSVTCEDRFIGKGASVRDCVTLDGRYFLCTDERNRIIRVFEISKQRELEYVLLEAEPFGITAFDNQTVAVSLPQNNQINIIEIAVSAGKVTSRLLRKIKTKYGIYGLDTCMIKEKAVLITLAKETGSFYLYNVDGTENGVIGLQISEKEKPLRGWNPLSYATYFTVDQQTKQIFISCQKFSKIMCIDLEGKCKNVYKHRNLQTPLGIKIGCNGNLFVCCYGSCQVLVLDKKGNIVEEISDIHRLRGPVAIDFDGDSKRCVVCDDDGAGKFKMVFYRWHLLQGQ